MKNVIFNKDKNEVLQFFKILFFLQFFGSTFAKSPGDECPATVPGIIIPDEDNCDHRNTLLFCEAGSCRCPFTNYKGQDLRTKWDDESSRCVGIKDSACDYHPVNHRTYLICAEDEGECTLHDWGVEEPYFRDGICFGKKATLEIILGVAGVFIFIMLVACLVPRYRGIEGFSVWDLCRKKVISVDFDQNPPVVETGPEFIRYDANSEPIQSIYQPDNYDERPPAFFDLQDDPPPPLSPEEPPPSYSEVAGYFIYNKL